MIDRRRSVDAVRNLLQRTVLAACLKSYLEAKEIFKEFITTTLSPLGNIQDWSAAKKHITDDKVLLQCYTPSLKSKLLVTKYVASII